MRTSTYVSWSDTVEGATLVATSELTQRESEVRRLAVEGLTNDEIAVRLEISRRTVEAHMRTLFRKTGVTRRAQLAALPDRNGTGDGAQPPGWSPADAESHAIGTVRRLQAELADCERRLQLHAAAVRRLVDRQFPLFEERVEMTVAVGEEDGQDTVIERHWTTPKPYLIYRILRPIVARTDAAPPHPNDLSLACDVYGQDIQIDIQPVQDLDGRPQILILFQPGLRAETEWVLRYRSPGLWDPLRSAGQDTLRWATATLDRREKPTINDLTLRIVFPAGWTGEDLVEQSNLGTIATERRRTGQVQATWHDSAPLAAAYDWVLRGSRQP